MAVLLDFDALCGIHIVVNVGSVIIRQRTLGVSVQPLQLPFPHLRRDTIEVAVQREVASFHPATDIQTAIIVAGVDVLNIESGHILSTLRSVRRMIASKRAAVYPSIGKSWHGIPAFRLVVFHKDGENYT